MSLATYCNSVSEHRYAAQVMQREAAPPRQHARYTYTSWARAFLRLAGYRRTKCNLGGVIAWQITESSDPAWKNPLDDTRSMPGSYQVNFANVQAYPWPWEGLRAAVFSLHYYPAIRRALAAGDDAQAVADAVQQVNPDGYTWGTQPFTAYCLP